MWPRRGGVAWRAGPSRAAAVGGAGAAAAAMYRALYSFRSAEPNSLPFAAGETFLLLERSNQHWWLVTRAGSGETGYAPASYLQRLQVSRTGRAAGPRPGRVRAGGGGGRAGRRVHRRGLGVPGLGSSSLRPLTGGGRGGQRGFPGRDRPRSGLCWGGWCGATQRTDWPACGPGSGASGSRWPRLGGAGCVVLADAVARCGGLQHAGTFWNIVFLPGVRMVSLKGGRRHLLWASRLETEVQRAPALRVRDKMKAQQLHREEVG